MMSGELLSKGESLHGVLSGRAYRVGPLLGAGGQGEVYREVDSSTRPERERLVIKWYYPGALAPYQSVYRQNLEQAAMLGAPSDAFLWPVDVVERPGVSGFGYVMPLRPARFADLAHHLTRKVKPAVRSLLTTASLLSDAYLSLHQKGWCYRDINEKNVFFDPTTGEVLVCDNDNVGASGIEMSAVVGTPDYMAPEVLRGDAMPSIETDLHSLAVLLFMILFISHPLEGQKEASIDVWDLAARRRVFGEEPVFIFDLDDDSNRPVPGLHDNALELAAVYPRRLKELFTQAFTQGLHNPGLRVRETVWRNTFAEIRDWVVGCPSCSALCIMDVDAGGTRGCWKCKQQVIAPLRLVLDDGRIVFLHAESELFPQHLWYSASPRFEKAVAKVVTHPDDPSLLGMTNLSGADWTVSLAGGSLVGVPNGSSVMLRPGTELYFIGEFHGRVEAPA